jgi:hypothetical protein
METAMGDEQQNRETEPKTVDATAVSTDELEDLEPTPEESEALKGGSSPPGWNRVRNIQ